MKNAVLGGEKFIDKIILSTEHPMAHSVERRLQNYASKHRAAKSPDPTLPLYGRGQSGLYRGDVLGLDDSAYPSEESNEKFHRVGAINRLAFSIGLLLSGLIVTPFAWGAGLLFLISGWITFPSDLPSAKLDRSRPAHPKRIRLLLADLVTRQQSNMNLN